MPDWRCCREGLELEDINEKAVISLHKMKTISKFLLFFAAFVVPELVSAQSAREFYDTAKEIEAEADIQLNTAYQHLVESIETSDNFNRDLVIQRLRESQRAWLKYRDAQASFVALHAQIGSSSARALGTASYSAELTTLRIKDLENVPNPF